MPIRKTSKLMLELQPVLVLGQTNGGGRTMLFTLRYFF
jgi:hypothetical protein